MSNLKEAVRALNNGAQPKKGQLASAMQAIAQQTQQATQQTQHGQITVIKEKLQVAIKSERISQGLTQRQLAYKCNTSQATIARAEKHGWISFWTLIKIANGLNKEISLT